MARTKWYLRQGIAFPQHTLQSKSNNFGFDLEKYVKKELRHFNVDAYDTCCGAQFDEDAELTVEDVERGLIFSAGDAAVELTLPDSADFNATKGKTIYFIVDNSAGTDIVTITPGDNTSVASAVITGADTVEVASGDVGKFQIYFPATGDALLSRLV